MSDDTEIKKKRKWEDTSVNMDQETLVSDDHSQNKIRDEITFCVDIQKRITDIQNIIKEKSGEDVPELLYDFREDLCCEFRKNVFKGKKAKDFKNLIENFNQKFTQLIESESLTVETLKIQIFKEFEMFLKNLTKIRNSK